MSAIAILILLLVKVVFHEPNYVVSRGIRVYFADKTYISRIELDSYVYSLIKKWSIILKKIEQTKIDERLSEIKIIITDKEGIDFFPFKSFSSKVEDVGTKTFERRFHILVARVLFPSFTDSFRWSIISKFNIL